MKLIDLWNSLTAKGSAEEQAASKFFQAHIEDLHASLEETPAFQEYPKWVDGVVVEGPPAEEAMAPEVPAAEGVSDVVVQPEAAQATPEAPAPEVPATTTTEGAAP